MQINNLDKDDTLAIEQAAHMLVEGFGAHWPKAWPGFAEALEEVHEALTPERICRIARDDNGAVLGWVGAIPEYDGNAWELHPLVVRSDQQRRGIGRALVADLEQQVALRGGITLYLGSDDESNLTSLADSDLYSDVFAHIAAIRNLGGHPYSFYQRCGFVIVGVIPDANGLGKPDILMAKRVQGA